MTKPKNPWMLHLAKVRAQKKNQGKPLGECMKLAKKTYKPVKK